jgi:phage shock protein C
MVSQRLYRSRGERMIAGVCGGIAQYFAIDPTLVRLFAVLSAIFSGGAVVLVYFVLWVIVPEEPLGASTMARAGEGTSEASSTTGAASEASSTFGSSAGWSEMGGFGFTPTDEQRQRRSRWIGFALLGLGMIILASHLHLFSWVQWNLIWPVILILGGFFLLMRQQRQF